MTATPRARECVLAIEGGTLTALRMGEPGGVPVLALHGWLDNLSLIHISSPRD